MSLRRAMISTVLGRSKLKHPVPPCLQHRRCCCRPTEGTAWVAHKSLLLKPWILGKIKAQDSRLSSYPAIYNRAWKRSRGAGKGSSWPRSNKNWACLEENWHFWLVPASAEKVHLCLTKQWERQVVTMPLISRRSPTFLSEETPPIVCRLQPKYQRGAIYEMRNKL